MASFLSGPAAQLVGAGMQAIGLGIPVGQTSAKVIEGLRDCGLPVPPKNWFKRKDDASSKDQQQQARDERLPSKTIYDKLESHINGMMQVVKPAIELKKLVRENCCKSAERPRRGQSHYSFCSRFSKVAFDYTLCDNDHFFFLVFSASSESPKEKLRFYTPQKCSSSVCNLFDNEQKSPSAKVRIYPIAF